MLVEYDIEIDNIYRKYFYSYLIYILHIKRQNIRAVHTY